MYNPWKIATLGLALTGVTALSTGVTTAYLMRPATTPVEEAVAPAHASYVTAPRAITGSPAPVTRAKSAPRTVAAASVSPGAIAQPAVVTRPSVVQQVAAPVATDCATGGQRAMKIAKPGLIGTLAGAGLGAVGGALADGGSGAGKGAMIGGLAGAALGSGYGAYKTKQECGTIFGSAAPGFASAPTIAGAPSVAPQAAWTAATNGITVFNAGR
jgi:hypothetical protein